MLISRGENADKKERVNNKNIEEIIFNLNSICCCNLQLFGRVTLVCVLESLDNKMCFFTMPLLTVVGRPSPVLSGFSADEGKSAAARPDWRYKIVDREMLVSVDSQDQ